MKTVWQCNEGQQILERWTGLAGRDTGIEPLWAA